MSSVPILSMLLVLPIGQSSSMASLFDKSFHDFGQVPRGSLSVQTFKLKNTTSQTLKITGLRSTCVCASPSSPSFEAKPGETLSVDVKYDTKTFAGHRAMTIYVYFSEPTNEVVSLRVQGFSRQDVVSNPGSVDFGTFAKGEPVSRTAKIEYAGTLDWRIQETLASPHYDAEVRELYRQPGRVGYEVTVKPKLTAPAGPSNDILVFKTNDPQSPQIQLPVTAQIHALVSASPEVLDLGDVPAGEKIVKRVMVRGAKPFSIVKVSGDVDGIEATASQGERNSHIVSLTFTAGKPGEIRRNLLIETTVKEQPKVAVRINGKAM